MAQIVNGPNRNGSLVQVPPPRNKDIIVWANDTRGLSYPRKSVEYFMEFHGIEFQ